jgi:hypothetical protein
MLSPFERLNHQADTYTDSFLKKLSPEIVLEKQCAVRDDLRELLVGTCVDK